MARFKRFTSGMTPKGVSWTIAVAALLLIVLIRVTMEPATAGEAESCDAQGDTIGADVDRPAVLIPRDGELLNFRWVFDADDTVQQVSSMLDWQSPSVRPDSLEIADQLAVRFPKELSNEENDESIPRDQISARAVVTGNGVELSICVDTSGASPDEYTGAVSFVDRDIKAAPFTIDVTVKHRKEWIPLAAIVAALALSLIILVFSVAGDPSSKPATIAALAVLAILTAVVARPWATWQDNPTWGKDRFDFVTLFAATALAFIGAMSIPDALKDRKKAAAANAVAAGSPAPEQSDQEPATQPEGEETP